MGPRSTRASPISHASGAWKSAAPPFGPTYLSHYANEVAYREETRREPNGTIFRDILSKCAHTRPRSVLQLVLRGRILTAPFDLDQSLHPPDHLTFLQALDGG